MVQYRFIAIAVVVAALAAGCVTKNAVKISMPPWAEKAPQASDYREVYPTAARRQEVTGQVHLACTIRTDRKLECAVENENPPGMGFGAAAMALSHAFVVKAEKVDPRLGAGKMVHVPFRFALGD